MGVTYTEYFKDGKEKSQKDTACFAHIFGSQINNPTIKIDYNAPIPDESLKEKQIVFYLDFISSLLDKEQFTFKINKTTYNKNCTRIPLLKRTLTQIWNDIFPLRENMSFRYNIEFSLNCKNLSRNKALLYLVAFRYLQEFPLIINEFYEICKDKNLEEQFKNFISVHLEGENYKHLNYNHGLVYNYSTLGRNGPANLQQFKENLLNPNISNVFDHFGIYK